jgi:hypothetical protein
MTHTYLLASRPSAKSKRRYWALRRNKKIGDKVHWLYLGYIGTITNLEIWVQSQLTAGRLSEAEADSILDILDNCPRVHYILLGSDWNDYKESGGGL